MRSPEQILYELGLVLPAPFMPAADYVACRRVGDVLHIAGHGPMRDGKAAYVGKVGADVDIETGVQAAELTMLNVLASIKADLGELSRVTGFVQLSVFVNATPEFACTTSSPTAQQAVDQALRTQRRTCTVCRRHEFLAIQHHHGDRGCRDGQLAASAQWMYCVARYIRA
jgi:enamine deaminase RidA (YjgF/YER057c/UK114 family)